MKKKIFVLPVFLTLMMLAACGDRQEPAESSAEEPAVSAVVSAEEAESPAAEPEETGPRGINPLTGMPIEETEEHRRPVAVMLNDLKAAQPQLGVSQADLIYEVPAEGGITRMVAVFQSLDGVGNLGSIRSTRAYYLELALGHDALLVHAGGSPEAYRDIPVWGVDNMDGVNGGSDAKIFWRDAERRKTMKYEHSLLTSGERIQEYLDAGHFRTEHPEGYQTGLLFSENGTPETGTAAEHVSVKYSNYKTATFDYESNSGTYLVGQYGGAYVDGNSGKQVGVTNVLVLEAGMHVISGDTYGRLAVQLTGSGKGSYYCGGKTVPVQWSKKDRNAPFQYTMEDGTPLTMGRGNTYICIYSPKTGQLSVS